MTAYQYQFQPLNQQVGGGGFLNNKPGGGFDWAGTVQQYLPLVLGAAGSYLTNRSANKNAQANTAAQQAQSDAVNKALAAFMGQNQGAGVDQMILDQFTKGQKQDYGYRAPDIQNVYQQTGLATDPILQSMRRGPNDSALSSNLLDLLGTGDPYDTTQVSQALQPLRDRALNQQVAALQAGAPGLGQRFGTANRNAGVQLRAQDLQNNNALDAQMFFQGHEAAQGRRLQAAGLLNDQSNIQLGRDNGALSALLGLGNIGLGQNQNNIAGSQLGLDYGKLQLAGQGQNNQLLELLSGNNNSRSQQLLQAIGLMTGNPVPQNTAGGYGGTFGDISQLLLLTQLLGGKK